jgi:hypothetical protein
MLDGLVASADSVNLLMDALVVPRFSRLHAMLMNVNCPRNLVPTILLETTENNQERGLEFMTVIFLN